MKAWHMAEGQRGRRLLAGDLREDNRVVAVLAWMARVTGHRLDSLGPPDARFTRSLLRADRSAES